MRTIFGNHSHLGTRRILIYRWASIVVVHDPLLQLLVGLDSLISVGDQGGSSIGSISDNTGDLFRELLGGGLGSLAGALDSLARSFGRGLDGHVVDRFGLGNALDTDKFRLEDYHRMLGVVASIGLG